MGCGGSKDDSKGKSAAPAAAPAGESSAAVPAQAAGPASTAPPAGAGRSRTEKPFQIKLAGKWENYDKQEDQVLKRAFLVGQKNAGFELRGQRYEYDFTKMKQKNLGTAKERDIRPPRGLKAPSVARLPPGPMIVINVPPGSAGKCIEIDDPNNKGQKIKVNVPKGAKKGSKLAVPVPAKGETVAQVRDKQKGWSKTAKLAMGTAGVAAVGAVAVGGVILGDHLSGGAVADFAGDHLGEDAGDAVADATAWTVDVAGDAAAWTESAVEDFPDWAEGAAEDVGEAFEDVGDWLGDGVEDAGDFIMDLF